jgi:hypothetical protein
MLAATVVIAIVFFCALSVANRVRLRPAQGRIVPWTARLDHGFLRGRRRGGSCLGGSFPVAAEGR